MVDHTETGTCNASSRIQPARGDDGGIGLSGGDRELGKDGIA